MVTSQPLHQVLKLLVFCTASAAEELLRPHHAPEREKVAGQAWKIVMEGAILQQVQFLTSCAS
jgi:hypothetical protein